MQLELIVRFPSAMMKMPCQHQAQNQAPEVGKDLLHLKLQPEEEEGEINLKLGLQIHH